MKFMSFQSWLAQTIQDDGCCQSENISYLWADPNQEDVLDYFATQYDLNTVRMKDVEFAAEEIYQKTQSAIASDFPDEIQVWRCGGLAGDVTSVTTNKRVAVGGCSGGYYGGKDATVASYMVNRSDVLVSIEHFWPAGDFVEDELLVRPGSLRPLKESLLREYIRELLTEVPAIKHKGDYDYFRVELGKIGYAQGGTHLRFQDCQSDVDALKQTPEYLEAEEKWMKNAKPRTDIVRDENGEWVMAETGELQPFTPKFYDVDNAWIHDEANRGKGHGKEIYKAFIDKASEYAKRNGGVFIGAHHCTLGSGTSDAAKRLWKSLVRDYTSSGDVIFIGL
jgi:hypothetical protein